MNCGGWLPGSLQGKKSTRIAQRYRLISQPNEQEHVVYLIAIDHRKRCTRNSNAYKSIGTMEGWDSACPPLPLLLLERDDDVVPFIEL